MRRAMNHDRGEFDPRKFLKEATAAAKSVCKARFEAFGCAGRIETIKPISMERMAERYVRGELAPRVH
jgi:fructose-bisphosphate aldolase class II